jgi:hypothetical protein
MARKPFLLRIDAALLDVLQQWANDDLRSLNGQIEWLLRRAAVERGRLKEAADGPAPKPRPESHQESAPADNAGDDPSPRRD